MSNYGLSVEAIDQFQRFLLYYYTHYGRHTLPWRIAYEPYKVLVSEIMLQQTQVDRVIPKFNAFMTAFPTVQSLATASLANVLSHWQGLGYNRRAKFLHQAAQAITTHYAGVFPSDKNTLLSLPGIGPYTASAIQAFAFNQPVQLIETNVRTVFLHHFFPDNKSVTDKELEPLITQTLYTTNPRQWYSALMDYGSFLKSQFPNPSRRSKHYVKQSPFKGSRRQVRGEVLKILTTHAHLTYPELLATIAGEITYLPEVLHDLETEGFIVQTGTGYSLNYGKKI